MDEIGKITGHEIVTGHGTLIDGTITGAQEVTAEGGIMRGNEIGLKTKNPIIINGHDRTARRDP